MDWNRSCSAHLGYLFTELAYDDRFCAARDYGFRAIEHPAPYNVPAADLAQRLSETGLTYTQFAMPSGDAAAGEKGIAIFPERRSEFRAGVATALDYAERIGVSLVHVMAGVLPPAQRTQDHWECYLENLEFAADAASPRGIQILVEAMSKGAVPDYFIEVPDTAARAIAEIGRMNVKILLDIFHSVASELDPVEQIRRHRDHIAHVHIADYPGRHEPGTGQVDFRSICQELDSGGYRGLLGCEYIPLQSTVEGLGWFRQPFPAS
jgi:hydroxypyruvate isomerase